jgi:hypothetical protein
MKLPDEIYVVVLEDDGTKEGDPIIFETNINEQSTKEAALERAKFVKDSHKKETTIARVVFYENDHLIERLKSQKKFELVMIHKVIIKTNETDYAKLHNAVELTPTSRNPNVRIIDHKPTYVEINQAEPMFIDLSDAMTDEEIAQCMKK